MPPKKQRPNFEELQWTALVAGNDSGRRFQRAIQSSRGWESDNSTRFPMDVILAFPKPVNIWKFEIGVSDSHIREFLKNYKSYMNLGDSDSLY